MVQSFYIYLLLYQESNVCDTSKNVLRSASWMLITNNNNNIYLLQLGFHPVAVVFNTYTRT